MHRNYDIINGIYLTQANHKLDLHNNFDFKDLEFSVAERKLVLNWARSTGDWVKPDTPKALCIEFSGVSEFRFLPRDPDLPFTEDDCVNSIGYWVDEDWAAGVFMVEPEQTVEPEWLTAIDFMSGAVVIVRADSAKATITP